MKNGKRLLSMLLVALFAFSVSPLLKANAAETIYFGDINENGTVEAADARLILRYAVDLETFSKTQTKLADCDNNGDINASDARKALRVSVNLESPVKVSGEDSPENNDITDKSTATVAALSEIWTDVIRDADLLVAFGTTSSEEVACHFTSPADFDLSDTEMVSAVFQISVENAAKVTEIGYVMHMMNSNNLTVAAYALAEGIDAVVFANSIKEEIAATQWIMGMPDQILVAVTDSAVIAAFGTRDIITAFYNVLSVNNTVIIEDIN